MKSGARHYFWNSSSTVDSLGHVHNTEYYIELVEGEVARMAFMW